MDIKTSYILEQAAQSLKEGKPALNVIASDTYLHKIYVNNIIGQDFIVTVKRNETPEQSLKRGWTIILEKLISKFKFKKYGFNTSAPSMC
jgi:hypothetical protein